MLGAALDDVDNFKPKSEMLGGKWADMVWPASPEAVPNPETGLPVDRLIAIGKASVELPDSFVRHPLSALTAERAPPVEATHQRASERAGDKGGLCDSRGNGVWISHGGGV